MFSTSATTRKGCDSQKAAAIPTASGGAFGACTITMMASARGGV